VSVKPKQQGVTHKKKKGKQEHSGGESRRNRASKQRGRGRRR
jgi:hypothetical protein